jgi:hypothetical protein
MIMLLGSDSRLILSKDDFKKEAWDKLLLEIGVNNEDTDLVENVNFHWHDFRIEVKK